MFSRLFLFLLLLTPSSAFAVDVLIVGNSYVGSNNLGSIVSGMLDAQGAGNRVEAHSPGGRRFVQHLADADGTTGDNVLRTWMTKDATGWNVVVFQEQSQIPAFWGQDSVYDTSLQSLVGLDDLAEVVVAPFEQGLRGGPSDFVGCDICCTFTGEKHQWAMVHDEDTLEY